MCMIIYRPKGTGEVDAARLRYIAGINGDGFGLMWSTGTRLFTARYAVKQKKAFITRFLALQSQDVPMCAHFRWSTHGGITRGNTHPFVLVPNMSAMMHNGVLDIRCLKGWSDTRTFAELVLKRLPPGWEYDTDAPWNYLVDRATAGSRVVIMLHDGAVKMFHQERGTWEAGIWYSNDNFKPKGYTPPVATPKTDNLPSVYTSGYDTTNRWKEGMEWDKHTKKWYYPDATKLPDPADTNSKVRGSHKVEDAPEYRGNGSHKDTSKVFSGDSEDGWLSRGVKKVFARGGKHEWGSSSNNVAGEVGTLYLWDQFILCAECLKSEGNENEAIPIPETTTDDVCEFCGVIGGLVQEVVESHSESDATGDVTGLGV